jgi:phosphohistidine phosphatase
MELILWRHAEAEARQPRQADADRALTGKGRKQAKRMADWLGVRLKGRYRLLVSPALRTRQTAEALSKNYEPCEDLGSGATARRLLQASGWPEQEGTVILVGHRPGLNRLASLLLTGRESEWEIKKGAVWWFQSRGEGEAAHLRAVVSTKDI